MGLLDFDCTTVQATLQQRATPTADWVMVSRSQLVKFAAIDPDPALSGGLAYYREMSPKALARRDLATQGDTKVGKRGSPAPADRTGGPASVMESQQGGIVCDF
jgi:hypothetical protein